MARLPPDTSRGEFRDRFDVWGQEMDTVDFEQFLSKRGVGYDGEEVKLAQIVWDAVRNSLPDQVGQLPLLDFWSTLKSI